MAALRLYRRRMWSSQRLVSFAFLSSSVSIVSISRSISSSKSCNPSSFESLARVFSAIEEVKNSRLASIRLLASEYRQLLALPTSQELTSALYLTASQLAPSYEGVELQFGAKTFVKILKQLDVQHDMKTLKELLATYPDYGQATQALLTSGRFVLPVSQDGGTPLSIQAVHEQLVAIAQDKGAGGVARKQQVALKLLQQCRCNEERLFVVRMLAHQNLRIGMGEKSILSALAMASVPSTENCGQEQDAVALTVQEKSWVDCVTMAYAQHPNYSVLARLLHDSQHIYDIERRIEWLHNAARPVTGVPVLTMSAYPVSSVAAVLDRIGKTASRTATCEYKYDGARVQVHLSLPTFSSTYSIRRIFSRNMEDVTERYSSLLNVLEKRLIACNSKAHESTLERSLIVEGEVVALKRQTGTFLPFQVLLTKTTSEFCLFLFDLLAVDGTNLLQEHLRKRRALLHNLLEEKPGYLEFVKHIDINLASSDTMRAAEDASERIDIQAAHVANVVQNCLNKAVVSGCEGLIVKSLDDRGSEYQAGRRSFSWMKLKHDYLLNQHTTSKTTTIAVSGNGTFLVDTLDLVPIGAFYGKGQRAGVFGSFLMATYNSTSGKFETIGKVGTGFSYAHLTEVAARLHQHILRANDEVPELYQFYNSQSCYPDVWFSPAEVWEIKATQLTESPSYTCGAVTSTGLPDAVSHRKGLALRFPRFIRYRPDKKPMQATESEQVVELYHQQRQQVPY